MELQYEKDSKERIPFEHYMDLFQKADAKEMSQRTGLPYDEENATFTLRLMGVRFIVYLFLITLTTDIFEAAKDADVIFTDVWASMGQEGEAEERKKIFKNYQINDDALNAANEGVMVLHCLPAHREEEITAKVFEAHADEIFDEAENRLHAQKAVMVKLMKKKQN